MKPMFVKIEEYKDVKEITTLMRSKVADAQKIMDNISKLKQQEEQELSKCTAQLENMQQRLDYIQDVINQKTE
jgi:hypothetical protein